MPAWKTIEQAEPEFAGRVRRLFDAGRHKTIATVRGDGSPRISGIECEFADGELRFGSMTGARKGADLKRGWPCSSSAMYASRCHDALSLVTFKQTRRRPRRAT